jgi:hypothetical protein
MKRLAPIAFALATALGMSACATGGYYDNGPYAYGYVDGYYDDYYGPFYDGYWGPDDFFYYRTGPHDAFRRDDAHHFSHRGSAGFHTFHARAAARGAHPDEHR